MMRSFESDRGHRSLADTSDADLEEYLETLRDERNRLADLYYGDRVLLSVGGDDDRPLGKLRPRLASTKEKWRACRAKQVTVEAELARRRARARRLNDWEEPTDTDLERLLDKLRAS